MDDDIEQNINDVDDEEDVEIVVDQCLVSYQQIKQKETVLSAW